MALFQPATTLQPFLDSKKFLTGDEKYVTHMALVEDGKNIYGMLSTDGLYRVNIICSEFCNVW